MSFSFIEWTPVIDDRNTQKVCPTAFMDCGCKGKEDIGFSFINALRECTLSCSAWTFFYYVKRFYFPCFRQVSWCLLPHSMLKTIY